MKIMYYELIKMLIAYERREHSSGHDTSTTVGKIEGYQELTNRLQRYLNQRFIVDVDQLKKKTAEVCHVEAKHDIAEQGFGQMEERIKQLEANFFHVKEINSKLEKNYMSLEQTNLSLVNKINVMEMLDYGKV